MAVTNVIWKTHLTNIILCALKIPMCLFVVVKCERNFSCHHHWSWNLCLSTSCLLITADNTSSTHTRTRYPTLEVLHTYISNLLCYCRSLYIVRQKSDYKINFDIHTTTIAAIAGAKGERWASLVDVLETSIFLCRFSMFLTWMVREQCFPYVDVFRNLFWTIFSEFK